jgi:DNA-binding NarL/FixJ family response regulator
MKVPSTKKTQIRIVVIDGDPLRYVGFHSCLSSDRDFDVQPGSLSNIATLQDVDVVLLGRQTGKTAIESLSLLRTIRPDLNVILTACNLRDEDILQAILAGAKGCIDEATTNMELGPAIRIVQNGSVWAPRRILAMFVERTYQKSNSSVSAGQRPLTLREKEVLRMLVTGCSNKEIALPLGIEERTVKAHVAKLMRKVGVPNRILLSVHAITHSLVTLQENA